MNVFSRGIRNAFRNGIRTLSIIIILGLSIGLSLTMLLANKAVANKIASVKSSIGNTITIAPAGYNGFSSVNNALTTSELAKVQSIAHVTNLDESLIDRLTTIGSTQPSFGSNPASTSNSNNQTSLISPVKLNTSGSGGGGRFFVNGGGSFPTNFSLPITIIGTSNPTNLNGGTVTISSGKTINGTVDADEALISSSMATKNTLKVGSTFTAYGTTITVNGIFTSSTQAGDGDVVVSLPTEQRLSGQSGDVTSAIATVDSLDNLDATTTAIKNILGSAADVTNAVAQADQTVQPLNSVKTISLFSLIGAVIAGAIIILLVMIMMVRERKREIGVVKAIGGSNLRIMVEFMVEALTLTILGAVIGLLIGVVGGQPVTKLLVNSSSSSSTTTNAQPGGFAEAGGGAASGRFTRGIRNNGAVRGLSNIKTQVGWSILLDGFGAAVLIAVVGSALAAGLIAKVRPSEVLRSS